MRPLLSILLGFPLFIFLVFNPMRAKIIASIAVGAQVENKARISLLSEAHSIHRCNTNILMLLGDIAANDGFIQTAIWSYGQAILCSPGDAIARIKYGEALVTLGFNGLFAIKEATMLEPNNPVFRQEIERVTKLGLPHY